MLFQLCGAIEVRDLQRIGPHTSVFDIRGPGRLPAPVGQHTRPSGLPAGLSRPRLHRPALLQNAQVTWSTIIARDENKFLNLRIYKL